MKKIISVILIFAMLLTFAACGDDVKTPTADELVSVSPEEAEELFEDMTDLAKDGKFDKAINSYIEGGAGSTDEDLLNWYFYSLAMNEYETNGCIGYPVTLLEYNTDEDFELAQTALSELRMRAREFNGVYEFNGTYLYMLDGKVAMSVGERITDMTFTSYELAYKNGDYFIMHRNSDGAHMKAFTMKYNGGILSLIATDENANDMYEGSYIRIQAEYPEILY